MNNLLSLLSQDSLGVAHLQRIYAAYGANQGFAADAIRAMRQLDAEVAWRAVWLVKRLAVERRLSDEDLMRLTQCADEMTHWAARLNLCQLFAATGCPAVARETLYPYLIECFANRRPTIRAWAISILIGFRSDARYRDPVTTMVRAAQADSAACMQARLRRLGLKRASLRSVRSGRDPRL